MSVKIEGTSTPVGDKKELVEFNSAKGPESRNLGLQDGGKTVIICSACQEPLAIIGIVNPTLEINSVFQVNCCYCGDHSFEHSFHGSIVWAGYAIENPDDPDDIKEKTKIANIVKTPEKNILETVKA